MPRKAKLLKPEDPRLTIEKELLGKNLIALRVHQDLTQEELAHQTGIDTSTLGNIERATANPEFNTIILLAFALGVRWVDFGSGDIIAVIERLRVGR